MEESWRLDEARRDARCFGEAVGSSEKERNCGATIEPERRRRMARRRSTGSFDISSVVGVRGGAAIGFGKKFMARGLYQSNTGCRAEAAEISSQKI